MSFIRVLFEQKREFRGNDSKAQFSCCYSEIAVFFCNSEFLYKFAMNFLLHSINIFSKYKCTLFMHHVHRIKLILSINGKRKNCVNQYNIKIRAKTVYFSVANRINLKIANILMKDWRKDFFTLIYFLQVVFVIILHTFWNKKKFDENVWHK